MLKLKTTYDAGREQPGVLHLRRFTDYSDLLDYAEVKPTGGCSSRDGSLEFTGTCDFAECMNLARNGWKKGAEVDRMRAAIDKELQTIYTAPTGRRLAMSVAGHAPNIGQYLTGRPDCMYRWKITERKPVISILANNAARYDTPTSVIINRGAALVALIVALQAQGRSVAIDCLATCVDNYDQIYCITVPLKKAYAPLEIDRLVFALCHPSMLRRISFSVSEHENGEIRSTFGFRSGAGYGRPCDPPKETIAAYSLYAPICSKNSGIWDTPKAAAQWLFEELKRQGATTT